MDTVRSAQLRHHEIRSGEQLFRGLVSTAREWLLRVASPNSHQREGTEPRFHPAFIHGSSLVREGLKCGGEPCRATKLPDVDDH
ncbi:hypothetical protein D187_009992 [Cystobacter fuscus DSM 2262]|uniref:Uncharacterized protein n=1 Tax=Cystobacter fuscus (strain ATCC 25194 / DSM 2262 / NBRC 100088 / M29) TaxID=1242864 RepID=S9QZK8_CYSF2|nr:hypothetical protein D187_009992 [Cystobacter fuscus DSM 2262]